jgi:hypothetical protein
MLARPQDLLERLLAQKDVRLGRAKPDGAECAFGKKGQEPIDPGLWGPLQGARPTASQPGNRWIYAIIFLSSTQTR